MGTLALWPIVGGREGEAPLIFQGGRRNGAYMLTQHPNLEALAVFPGRNSRFGDELV